MVLLESQISIVSFNIKEITFSEISYILDHAFNTMIRFGFHCTPYAHKAINTFLSGTILFSLGYFDTKEEIDIFIKALKSIIREKKKH